MPDRVEDPVSAASLVGRALIMGAPLYVGAVTNRANIGDALLFESHENLLGRLGYVPMGGKNRLLRLITLTGRRCRTVLGGGTLIGRPSYRRAIESSVRVGSRTLLSMLGTGVSAPSPLGKSSSEELGNWAPLLKAFPKVRVRGPRSAEILNTFGISASVVGDPVLSLLRPMALATSADRLRTRSDRQIPRIGVNAADVPQADDLEQAVLEGLEMLSHSTPRPVVSVITASGYDDPAGDRLAGRLRAYSYRVERESLSQMPTANLRSVFSGLDVLISVRLHTSVIAAALNVPYVSLNYEDKCLDFQESVGLEERSVHADRAEPSWIVNWLLELLSSEEPPAHSTALLDGLVAAQCRAAIEALTELEL